MPKCYKMRGNCISITYGTGTYRYRTVYIGTGVCLMTVSVFTTG
jgi:hypothetical protein